MSGSAGIEKMTAYSVSSTGSTPVWAIAKPEQQEAGEREREPRLAQEPEALAPLPALVLGEVVGGGEAGVDRGAADGEQDADEGEDQAHLAVGLLGHERDRADAVGAMPAGLNSCGGGDQDRRRRAAPPSAKPTIALARLTPRSFSVHPSSTAPLE